MMTAKTKPSPKRPKLKPGAIFSVPLEDGNFAFGKFTPQVGIVDFYQVKGRENISATVLENYPTFRLKAGVSYTPFRKGRWVVFDSVEYPFEGFKLVAYRMGGLICCGSRVIGGFIDTSSASREATESELETIPSLSIYNTELAEHKLNEFLRSAPTL